MTPPTSLCFSDAKTSIRDYHGKTAAHYWSGCTDVFDRPEAQSGEQEVFILCTLSEGFLLY